MQFKQQQKTYCMYKVLYLIAMLDLWKIIVNVIKSTPNTTFPSQTSTEKQPTSEDNSCSTGSVIKVASEAILFIEVLLLQIINNHK